MNTNTNTAALNTLDAVLAATESKELINSDTSMFHIGRANGLTSARLKDSYAGPAPTMEQWLNAAELNWDVDVVNEQFKHNGITHYSGDKVMVRSDKSMKLGTFSSKYKPVSPKEILGFFSDLTENNGWEIIQAGYADNGKKVYTYAKTGPDFEIKAGDRTSQHILLASSTDGTMSTLVQPFFESFYCMNQLPAVKKVFEGIRIKHNTEFNPEKIKLDMGLYGDTVEEMRTSIDRMASKSVTKQEAFSMIHMLMKTKDNLEEESTRNINRMLGVYEKFCGKGMGANELGRKDTVWGVLNAITEFVDHDQCNSANSRWKSKTMGTGATLKHESFSILDLIAQEQKEIEYVHVPLVA